VGVHFCLPRAYPLEAPAASVVYSAGLAVSRPLEERLQLAVQDALDNARADTPGEECCIAAVAALQAALLAEGECGTAGTAGGAVSGPNKAVGADVADGNAAGALKSSVLSSGAPSCPTPMLHTLGRRLIWSHHIKSQTKRKHIVEWAAELALVGFCKPGYDPPNPRHTGYPSFFLSSGGTHSHPHSHALPPNLAVTELSSYPGIVVIEGPEQNCQEYWRRLRRLNWKGLVVKGEETEEAGPATAGSLDPATHAAAMAVGRGGIDSLRKFPHGSVVELAETDMSELARVCTEYGLRKLFMTQMH